MEFKDYYAVMSVEKSATPEDIKRAHRKLARRYHPDVSKEKDAEARFKELAEAYDVLKDPEKRAAYDRLGANYKAGQQFQPPPDWAGSQPGRGGYTQSFQDGDGQNHSAFFDSLFRGMGRGQAAGQQSSHEAFDMHGQDQHAKIQIDIEDSYNGATRTLQLRVQAEGSDCRPRLDDRTIEFVIPKGIRAGQHIRLAAQGGPAMGRGRPGDLYLDVEMVPHPLYRTDSYDWVVSTVNDISADLCLNFTEVADFILQTKIGCFTIDSAGTILALKSIRRAHAKSFDSEIIYQ